MFQCWGWGNSRSKCISCDLSTDYTDVDFSISDIGRSRARVGLRGAIRNRLCSACAGSNPAVIDLYFLHLAATLLALPLVPIHLQYSGLSCGNIQGNMPSFASGEAGDARVEAMRVHASLVFVVGWKTNSGNWGSDCASLPNLERKIAHAIRWHHQLVTFAVSNGATWKMKVLLKPSWA